MNLQFLPLILAVSLTLHLDGYAYAAQPSVAKTEGDDRFGLSKEYSVEVCMPKGEREYLSKLVCRSGEKPQFTRAGSVGYRNEPPEGVSEKELERIIMEQRGLEPLKPGTTDYHVIDTYEVYCGPEITTIYLDMYHCDGAAPQRAIKGFTHI